MCRPGAIGSPTRTRLAGALPPAVRAWALLLAAAALSAHLLLPLIVTCRTYRSLTLNEVPPCCAAKAACRTSAQGAEVPSLRAEGVNCPYCKAASPFRHASPATGVLLASTWAPLCRAPTPLPVSNPLAPPDLTAASPRAPPHAC